MSDRVVQYLQLLILEMNIRGCSWMCERQTKRKKSIEITRDKIVLDILTNKFSHSSKGTPFYVGSLVKEVASVVDTNPLRVSKELRILEKSGMVKIIDKMPCSFRRYMFSPMSNWFWFALSATVASLLVSLESTGIAIYFRYFFGSILAFFLPGYSLTELICSQKVPTKKANVQHPTSLERIILCISLSLLIDPVVAFFLDYTRYGITLFSLSLVLSLLATVFLILGLIRKYSGYKLSISFMNKGNTVRSN